MVVDEIVGKLTYTCCHGVVNFVLTLQKSVVQTTTSNCQVTYAA